MSSIYTAASALRNHQTFMNVVANNIANMNTIGYKSSSILFQDMLSQTLRNGAAPNDFRGGTNPVQYGLGMRLGAIQNNMGQGMLQGTGRGQDLAINGSGFFIYQGNDRAVYSRDGALGMDSEGALVNLSTGFRIQGWQADEEGVVNNAGQIGAVTIPMGAPMAAVATSNVTMAGNINASADIGDEITTAVQFYDSLGELHTADLTFTKSANNAWSISLESDDVDVNLSAPQPDAITFDNDGNLLTPDDGLLNFTGTLGNGAADVEVALDIGNITQLATAGADSLYITGQDGRAAGEMIDFNINDIGEITGIYSNGLLRTLGQVALAEFVNPAGLEKMGQNVWAVTGNSGEPQIVTAGDRSQISAGFLEMSNVDLTLEFSEMIRAQRGFQANSRVITSSDEMIQELVNLVR